MIEQIKYKSTSSPLTYLQRDNTAAGVGRHFQEV